jgi:hypothetical protein
MTMRNERTPVQLPSQRRQSAWLRDSRTDLVRRRIEGSLTGGSERRGPLAPRSGALFSLPPWRGPKASTGEKRGD